MGKRRKTSVRKGVNTQTNAPLPIVSSSSQNFVVEKILDSCVDVDNRKWYFLKWLGYPADQATWEPKTNLDCTGLIKEYEKNKLVAPDAGGSTLWSLKQEKGTSTKIVLKKVNLVSLSDNSDHTCVKESLSDNSDHTCVKESLTPKVKIRLKNIPPSSESDDYDLNCKNNNYDTSEATTNSYDSPEVTTNLPKRHSKRRRSSTIGKQVSVSKKKKSRSSSPKLESVAVPVTEEEEEYTVETIVDKCLDANGKILYLIKWVGYDPIYNTWEPVEHLNCVEMLHEFNMKNKQPKVIISKIVEKKQTRNKVEYLVKISGCRKEKWMNSADMHCTELISEFNKEYDAQHSQKFSLADIADDCSSGSESDCPSGKPKPLISGSESDSPSDKPKPLVSRGIKINRDCTTSSDEDSFSPVHQKNKIKFIPNGHVLKPRDKSDSSSSSEGDFEDLLNQYNESVREEKSSPPPTPPSPPKVKNKPSSPDLSSPDLPAPDLSSPDLSSPDLSSAPLDPLANIKFAEYTLPTLVIPKEEKYHLPPLKKYSPVSPKKYHPASLEKKYHPASLEKKYHPASLEKKYDPASLEKKYDPASPLKSDFTAEQEVKFKPGSSPEVETKFKHEPKLEVKVSPAPFTEIKTDPLHFKSNYEDTKDNKTHVLHYLDKKPDLMHVPKEEPQDCDDNASSASDASSDSFSSIEKDLTEALESGLTDIVKTEDDLPSLDPSHEPCATENIPITQNSSFNGVDLGALILGHADKSIGATESCGLLDVIVSQTVRQTSNFDSLQSAFLETSATENNQSHSELFAVVAEHTSAEPPLPPSETEIDSVLDQIFVTSVSNELESISPGKFSIKSESTDVNSLDDIITNLDQTTRSSSPNLSTASCPKSPRPSVSPPFKSFMSTFSTSKSRKTTPKKDVSNKRTFGKKAAASSTRTVIESNPFDDRDDIFSNIGRNTTKSVTKKQTAKSVSTSLQCQFCTRKFKDKTKLDFHVSFKHPQMLEMTCDMCSQFFQSAIEYQCHQLTCGQTSE